MKTLLFGIGQIRKRAQPKAIHNLVSTLRKSTYRDDNRSTRQPIVMSHHSEPEEDTTIPVPWGDVKARWWGSKNKTPVICIHGWQDNAATFDGLIPLLPADISFLCIDLPGHGRSSHYPEGSTYYLMWDGVVLLRRIQKLYGWNKINLMGHSLGGLIGFFYAALYPHDIETLISLDAVAPVLDFGKKPRLAQQAEFIERHLYYDEVKDSKDPVDDYEEMIGTVVNGHHGNVTREGAKRLMTRGMYPKEDGKYMFTRDNRVKVGWISPASPEYVRYCAANIKCRYLNVKAIPYDDATWPAYKEVCDIIAGSAKEFKLVFAKGKHHVHLNEPEKISADITDFLLYSGLDEFCVV